MVPVSDDYGGHEGARLRGPAITLVPRIYSFPVGFADNPEGLVTFTRFGLRKNHREGKPVLLRLRGREVQGTAVAVRDTEWVAERFASLLRRKPRDGRYLGVGVAGTAGRTWGEPARFAARLARVRAFKEGASRVCRSAELYRGMSRIAGRGASCRYGAR